MADLITMSLPKVRL